MSEGAPPAQGSAQRAGFIAAFGAYLFWGFFPLYLKLLDFADVREVLGQRILWAAPAALAALLVLSGSRGLGELRVAFSPRMVGALLASSVFIFINWGLYLWLVLSERVIESSLAYFLAPLVSVAVGVAFFGERASWLQWSALALATIGVVVQALALGAPPWIALAICASWSAYAVIRKRAPVSATAGLFVESLLLAPVAAGLLILAAREAPLAFAGGWSEAALLASAGPATALPLILFAFGARRVSFTTLGLLQFVAPSLQFLTGLALGEPFTPLRAASFALIWLGLVLFSWDTLQRARRDTA